jgi:hypothetical protein
MGKSVSIEEYTATVRYRESHSWKDTLTWFRENFRDTPMKNEKQLMTKIRYYYSHYIKLSSGEG